MANKTTFGTAKMVLGRARTIAKKHNSHRWYLGSNVVADHDEGYVVNVYVASNVEDLSDCHCFRSHGVLVRCIPVD